MMDRMPFQQKIKIVNKNCLRKIFKKKMIYLILILKVTLFPCKIWLNFIIANPSLENKSPEFKVSQIFSFFMSKI